MKREITGERHRGESLAWGSHLEAYPYGESLAPGFREKRGQIQVRKKRKTTREESLASEDSPITRGLLAQY